MRSKTRLFGNYFATARDKLRAAVEHRGVHNVDNAVSLTAIATG